MAHYRKIDIRIWLDQKFNTLSSDSQFVFLYLLTHPQLTALGAMRSTVPGLAAELDWPLERFEAAFEALCQQALVAVDKKACFVWAMNFLKYNSPESPNVVKSWGTCLAYLPECDLKNQLMHKTRLFLETLPSTFKEALPDSFTSTKSVVNDNEAVIPRENLPVTLPEEVLEGVNVAQTSQKVAINTTWQSHAAFNVVFSETLPEVFAKPVNFGQESLEQRLAEGVKEGLPEAFAKTSLNHRALNIKHRTLSIKQEQEQKETYSEEKKEIGEINNIVTPLRQKKSKPPDFEIVDVFRYWKETMKHPQAVLDVKRRQRICQALASGYSVTQLCEAIRGCSYTPHNMGHNEQGQRYDGLHVILRDAEQIDRFIRNAHSPPRPQNAADRLMHTNVAAGQRWLEKKRRAAEKVINE